MTWEESIPFICFDERYLCLQFLFRTKNFFLVIPKDERKKIFYQFLKEENEDKKSKISIKKKDSIEKFKEFLKEIPIENTMTYSILSKKYSKDSRFHLLNDVDKETLFKEYYIPLQGRNEMKKETNQMLIKEFLQELENKIDNLSIQSKWNDIESYFIQQEKYKNSKEILEKEFYNFIFEKFEERDKSSEDEEDEEVEEQNEFKKDPKDEFKYLLKEFYENKKINSNTPTFGKKFKDLKKLLSQDERFHKIEDENLKDEMISNFIWELKK